MTAPLESTSEEERSSMDFVGLYEELEALVRRVEVQVMHIQQVKLEVDEGPRQHEEKLEEAGMGVVEELARENMSGGVVGEQQFSDKEPARVNTTTEWQAKSTKV